MEKTAHVSIGDEGFIVQMRNSTEQEKDVVCSEIRGSITPPTTSYPGYYAIFAQKAKRNESGKKPLLLLAEGKSNLQEELFDKLIAKNIRPMLWHDMMINWPDETLQQLAPFADLVVWGYHGHPDKVEGHYNTRYIERFKQPSVSSRITMPVSVYATRLAKKESCQEYPACCCLLIH